MILVCCETIQKYANIMKPFLWVVKVEMVGN